MTLQQLRYAVRIAEKKSMNKAAKELFITQPTLSSTVKELEEELGFAVFIRSNRGVEITADGEEFLGYARQIMAQYQLLEERFSDKHRLKKKFSVSMQHYTFAVQAFINLTKKYNLEDYEFAVHETKTYEVLENVKMQKSDLGIIYMDDFNEGAMAKVLRDNDLAYQELFTCGIYVYMWKNHPLAKRKRLSLEDLKDYPCLSFDQGRNNSFYLAEEVFSTYEYKQVIKANDRATLLNLMVGLNGYTLCSGLICEDLNGSDYVAIPLRTKRKMRIGYVKKRKMPLSTIGKKYLEELCKVAEEAQ